jgi:hypothetical protein
VEELGRKHGINLDEDSDDDDEDIMRLVKGSKPIPGTTKYNSNSTKGGSSYEKKQDSFLSQQPAEKI